MKKLGGVLFALVALALVIAAVVLQFVILARFRKKSAELCALTFVPPAPEAVGEDAEVSADAAQE